jgi:hypothetical protein
MNNEVAYPTLYLSYMHLPYETIENMEVLKVLH